MSTPLLQAFYKSLKWEKFIEALRIERANTDGVVLCEHCGKPIIKKYDCIGHHIEELTDDNVNDVTISLNPQNIMLVHFKCHNEIHKRFGYAEKQAQRVYIVYGSPCSGKTSFVSEVAEHGDIVLDINKLWSAIRADKCNDNEKPNELKQNVFALRDALIDMIKVRRGRWNNAYIVGGYPLQGERERLAEIVSADKLIFIDTPKDVCLLRAETQGSEMKNFVELWFERYTPPIA